MGSELWKDIGAPVVVGVVLALIAWLASKRSDVRTWFQPRPWATGIVAGVISAIIGSWLFALIFAVKGVSDPNVVPRDAVIAVSTKDKCPEGWKTFGPSVARFVIGAGTSTDTVYKNWYQQLQTGGSVPVTLSTHEPLSSGGEETHVLSKNQMPSHQHNVYPHAGYIPTNSALWSAAGAGAGGGDHVVSSVTSVEGGDQPFPLMPPFIALLYCEKSER